MARSRILPGLLAAWALGVAACGGQDDRPPATTGAATAPSTATTTAAKAPPPAECARVKAPRAKPDGGIPKPTEQLDPSRPARAVVETSCGTFTITLDVRASLRTASSFAYLARRGFYDNLTFHRIVPGFVIQGGDPTGTGTGGPGYSVVEEPPAGIRYTRGVVAMAKTATEAAGTSGSQFYVVTGEDAQLEPIYAVAGRVTSGMEVVDAISLVPTNQAPQDQSEQDRPLSPVVIRTITIQ